MSLPEPSGLEDSEDLRRRIEALERKLKWKTEALEDAFEEFQALIFGVSHDFRSPLRSIQSSAMILKEDHGTQLDSEANLELERQDASIRKLNAMLDELLKVSRLSRQEFKPSEVDFGEVAKLAAVEVGPLAEDALRAQDDVVLIADPLLLKAALQQVLDNSVKFASRERPLTIDVGASGGRFFVKDNGMGFEPSRAEKIFLPFEKLRGDEFPGYGVGLTIFKRIIDRHGGRVDFDSRPGEGATIWFELEEQV